MGLINDVKNINNFKSEINALKETNRKLSIEVENLTQAKALMENKLAELDGETYFSLKEKIFQLKTKKENMTDEIAKLQQCLEEQRKNNSNIISDMEEKICKMKKELSEYEKKVNNINSGKTFGIWAPCIHAEREQLSRQEKACNPYSTPINIDSDNKCGVFKTPDKNCKTTLNSCECEDFNFNKKPCRHMYRLAIELNLFDPVTTVEVDPILPKQITKADFINIAGKLTDEQLELLYKIAYSTRKYSNDYAIVNKGNDLDYLISLDLVKIHPEKDLILLREIQTLLKDYKKTDLLNMIPDTYEDKPESKTLKADITKYILKHRELHNENNLTSTAVYLGDSIRHIRFDVYEFLKVWRERYLNSF